MLHCGGDRPVSYSFTSSPASGRGLGHTVNAGPVLGLAPALPLPALGPAACPLLVGPTFPCVCHPVFEENGLDVAEVL